MISCSPACTTDTLADALATLRPGDYLLLPAAAAPAASAAPLPPQFAPLLAGLPPGNYVLLSCEVTWAEIAAEA
jgi:hypothetical protein